jgi:hypothetical protein
MLRRFWSYYQPYKKLFVLDFSCAVVLAILELSFPLFVNYVVDKLLPGNNWSLILAACTATSDVRRRTNSDLVGDHLQPADDQGHP